MKKRDDSEEAKTIMQQALRETYIKRGQIADSNPKDAQRLWDLAKEIEELFEVKKWII